MKNGKIEKEVLVSLAIICIVICAVLFGCAWGKEYLNRKKVDNNVQISNTDELYQKYLENRKESINKKYKNIENYDDTKEYSDSEHLELDVEKADFGDYGLIETSLTDAGLVVKHNDETLKEIKNVVYSKMILPETAPVFDVYYITDKGEVYDMVIELEDEKYVVNEIKQLSNLKRIVSIEPSWYGVRSGSIVATFIDIEGNIYTEE